MVFFRDIFSEFVELKRSSNSFSTDYYKNKYKPIALLSDILKNVILGRYVSFGVMTVYNDSSIDKTYSDFLKLFVSIPNKAILDYTKLSKSILSSIDSLLSITNISYMYMDWDTLQKILELSSQAIKSANIQASATACSMIDNMYSFLIESYNSRLPNPQKNVAFPLFDGERNRSKIDGLLVSRGDIARDLLFTIYDIILLDNRPDDWSLSRALFTLSVLQKDNLFQRSDYIVKSQPPKSQEQVYELISGILKGTEFSLTLENKDKFSDSITQYKKEVLTNNIILTVPTSQI
ncbi:Exportin-7-B [Smittium mucronatum]|uniref:Exportin-7-B n=1 Tax=Smittium mucronatum TaxID=133383 RepID=A0A1R0H3R1_9FUNG|nr:Exportin-7-B [Smittium mucronatum]OLY83819.1 Exportin-7-B [Smittium mucronatum]